LPPHWKNLFGSPLDKFTVAPLEEFLLTPMLVVTELVLFAHHKRVYHHHGDCLLANDAVLAPAVQVTPSSEGQT